MTSSMKMHANEVRTSVNLVRALLRTQFPQWADLPLKRVTSAGTDNAIFRLGDQYAVRLPRIDWAINQIDKEFAWLPKLRQQLPLTIPMPLAKGRPAEGYPYQWAVYAWLTGENSAEAPAFDLNQAAIDIAQFLQALQAVDTDGGPSAAEHNVRGMPLALRDRQTRQAIAAMGRMIDAKAAIAVWEAGLEAQQANVPPVWFHGDLLCGNVLVERGKVQAVIDFGGLAVGDPACDLMIAWSLFEADSRQQFRQALAIEEATWLRGRAHALSQAVLFIPYYLSTNPIGVRYAQRMLAQIFADAD